MRAANLAYDGFMNFFKLSLWKLRLWKDCRGQDMIEYALMAGFVAVIAGATMPSVATSISTIYSQVSSVIALAASQGS